MFATRPEVEAVDAPSRRILPAVAMILSGTRERIAGTHIRIGGPNDEAIAAGGVVFETGQQCVQMVGHVGFAVGRLAGAHAICAGSATEASHDVFPASPSRPTVASQVMLISVSLRESVDFLAASQKRLVTGDMCLTATPI